MPITYRTKPDPAVTGMPGGVPFIVGNEAAERFSFYGMRAILTVFMTKYLVDAAGNDATMTDEQAKGVFHLFVAAAYFTPMIGALIADIFWGKYRTILVISLMYCLGHGLLAMMDLGPLLGEAGYGGWDMEPFLYSGLFLIALGSGGIKPCVSAHVGDQFGTGNKHLMTQVFNWFYFSINLGAAASQIATPWLLAEYGPSLAFGVPGILMAIATFVFWLGRHQFIHVPPSGWKRFKAETFSPAGLRAIRNLAPLFLLFVPMFWAIFDQTGSAWVIQADQMNRRLGIDWLPSQIQFVNPIMILCGIPLFTYVVYPLMGKLFKVTPLRKIGIGLFLTAGSFAVSGFVQVPIEERGPALAVEVYSELQSDVASFPTDVARPAAALTRTTIAAAQDELEPAAIDDALNIRLGDLLTRIEADRFIGLIPSEKEAALLERTGAPDLAGALPVASAYPADELADLGLDHAAVARALTDETIIDVIPPARTAGIVNLLATQDEPSLTAAIKIARAAWLNDNGRTDEERIIDKLENMPSILWQFLAYFILTSAEILVSIVCLEFAYSQSPTRMKSFIMGVYFLGVSLGNVFVSGVNFVLELLRDPETGRSALEGASYYWFFTGLMILTAFIYVFWSTTYKGETFIQGEDEEDLIEAQAEAEGTEIR